ncbi:MGMT family protein [Pseudalkalibacillus sp. Hm43]|uniref:MGMT family protein n=1 Tax=Pseudalkalibacillus sp. Hm43 TaxID=3450742 RepID=UPI003F42943B
MKPFTNEVINIIGDIPPGKVMTYGQIAKLAGSPRGARQVVRVLHTMSKAYELPWHRVINAKGEISIQEETLARMQIEALEEEGVHVDSSNRVDLSQFRFEPDHEMDDVNII